MTVRERFLKTMHYQNPDRIPIWDFGFWSETIPTWWEQGLPKDIHIPHYFGMDRDMEWAPINLGMIPKFEVEILERDENTELRHDENGILARHSLKGSSIPQYLEFPVKNREDFEAMKKRHDPRSPKRYPMWWEDQKRCWKGRDYALTISVGGFFNWARSWMGLENLCMAFYDDPDLVHAIFDFMADFVIELVTPALEQVDFDLGAYAEDMAYRKTSMISADMFRKFMKEPYLRINNLLRKHGIDIIYVDSDGNIEELIPLWMETGINCMKPVEVGVWDTDVVRLRKEYGRDLLMLGGIDKRALMKDKKAVEAEVMAKVPPLLEDGGYIPHVDHRVPPDVPLKNYMYYLELVKKLAGA